MERRHRVVVAEPGLDGHDRRARSMARELRDAGFEVICTGPLTTAEQMVETVLQEDAEAIGLSDPAGAARVADELRSRGLDDVIVFDVADAEWLAGALG